MVNEGRLAPVVDLVQTLREDTAAGAGATARGGVWGKGAADAEDAAKGGGGGGKRSAAKKDVSSEMG